MYCMQKCTSPLGSYLINPLIQYEKPYCPLHCVGAIFFTVIISNTICYVNYSCQLIYPLVTFRFHNASKKGKGKRERQTVLLMKRTRSELSPSSIHGNHLSQNKLSIALSFHWFVSQQSKCIGIESHCCYELVYLDDGGPYIVWSYQMSPAFLAPEYLLLRSRSRSFVLLNMSPFIHCHPQFQIVHMFSKAFSTWIKQLQ